MRSIFFKELTTTLKHPDLWLYMSWMDIKMRYQRTKIGPFWMVIVSFISIMCVACLGSLLFKINFGDFFPYVTCGMIVWNYLSAMIIDSCTVFINQAGLIKHTNVSLLSFVLRMFSRNTIIFAHSLAIAVMVLIYYHVPVNISIIMLIPGMLIFFITAVALSIVLGLICTRFRDVLQLVQALIGVLAFLTPIMWKPEMLGEYQYVTYINPLTHYIALLREPLLGNFPKLENTIGAIIYTSILILMANMLFNKFKKRLVYWL